MRITADRHIPFLEGVFEPFGEVVYKEGTEIGREDARSSDALIIRTRTRCDASLLEGSRVRMIATATIGMDHIDLPYCRSKGIEVANAAGCNANAVMQYVFSAIRALQQKKGLDLRGKTIGIIGVGEVGGRVANFALSHGFKVLLCDPPKEALKLPERRYCSQDYLLEHSDIVTLHTWLDPTTRGMAGEDFFSKMKDGAIFINASRGDVVVDEALIKASERLGGIVIDTWNGEPNINRELLERVDIATPHIAGYSLQGKINGTKMAVQAVARHFGIKIAEGVGNDALSEVIAERVGNDVGKVPNDAEKVPNDALSEGIAERVPNDAEEQKYDIFADDSALRAHSENFEDLRSHYKLRDERIF